MADEFGSVHAVLKNEAGTGAISLYTCPDVESVDVLPANDIVTAAQSRVVQTQITSIVLSHVENVTTDSANIWILPTSSATQPSIGSPGSDDEYLITRALDVPKSSITILNPGILLTPGETIWASINGTDDHVAIHIFYIEIS